jgi:hypothetical protein
MLLAFEFDLTTPVVKSSVRKAFESSDFIGDANFLCDAVRDVFAPNNKRRYSNSFSIVQSSGTGKSRLVDEMAKTLFTFPFCVRDDDPPTQLCMQTLRSFIFHLIYQLSSLSSA